MRLFIKLLKFLLTLLEKKEVREEVKNVNQEVYQEIKDTPSANQVEIDTIVTTTITNPEPIIQPTTNLVPNLKIIERLLPPSQYVQDSKTVYNSIVLHHTAGGSAGSTINYWLTNKERVATHFIIDRNGDIYQCIPLEKAWAYHLYISSPGNKIDRLYKKLGSLYDKQSIGIEIASYGPCTVYEGRYVNTYGQALPNNKIQRLDKPFKGFQYFEKYTPEQINSLEQLLVYLMAQFPKIANNLSKDFSTMFDINQSALELKPGIYTHVNYRTDKSDCYNSPELIQMLNQLHTKV